MAEIRDGKILHKSASMPQAETEKPISILLMHHASCVKFVASKVDLTESQRRIRRATYHSDIFDFLHIDMTCHM